MDWFFGVNPKGIIFWCSIVYWASLILFLLVSGKNANVRWFVFLFFSWWAVDYTLVQLFYLLELTQMQQGFILVFNIVSNLALIWIIYERPFISLSFGEKLFSLTNRFPLLQYWFSKALPSRYPCHFYRQEHALIKVLKFQCYARGLMLMHYPLVTLGITSTNGVIANAGFERLTVYQIGYAFLLCALVLEMIVLISLVLQMVKDRLPFSAKVF